MKDIRKDIRKIIDENFITDKGKFNGQIYNENGFLKKGLKSEYKLFEELDILCIKNLYDYLNNTNEKCPNCTNKRNFYGFWKGYTEYCTKCARTLNNSAKNNGKRDFTSLDDLKDKRNLFSTAKINALNERSLLFIREQVPHLDKNTKMSEILFCLENKISEYPKCVVCNKYHNRFIANKGYKETCSTKCQWSIVDLSDRISSQKSNFYKKYEDFYKDFENNNKDYIVSMFSESDYQKSKENANIQFTHLTCNTSFELNVAYQGNIHCPKCYPIRSKQQFFILEYLQSLKLNVINNDRQLIKPKEIDILNHEFKFGIEYDSITYHSFGYNQFNRFNTVNLESQNKKYHVEKTNLVEEHDYQLFRIFSNEWLDNHKQSIWKSVINSKIGKCEKIFGRKCIIKEIDTKTSREFVNNNHLQGNINASIRIGLFYKEELVSVMTFGKSRRSKWKGENNYELLRFCSKLNTQIIGGGSKLLKYFERTYSPNLLISYANRRWSTGDFYKKAGFDYISTTKPNYFYFKGNDSANIESREKYQKHKQEKLLHCYNKELTESQNMYNNNYRKIYDCGHLVFTKNYK